MAEARQVSLKYVAASYTNINPHLTKRNWIFFAEKGQVATLGHSMKGESRKPTALGIMRNTNIPNLKYFLCWSNFILFLRS